MENDPRWQRAVDLPADIARVFGDWRLAGDGYGFVFIDHAPVKDRMDALMAFGRSADVALHDCMDVSTVSPSLPAMLASAEPIAGSHSMFLFRRDRP